MRLRFTVVLAVWCTFCAPAWPEQPSDMKSVADRLAASIYNGPSMATLGELADGIGGRLTGSPAYVRFHRVGSREVPKLRNRERALGALHDCCRLAAWDG